MMAESLATKLESILAGITETTALNKELGRRCRELEIKTADLEHEVSELKSELDQARLDAEYLCVSHKLADNPDNLVAARRQIARLIRNIDRCLEMLKE